MIKLTRRSRVLVIHYSQSGQLDSVAHSLVKPLLSCNDIQVDFLNLRPQQDFPFPWPLLRFINAFPESAHQIPCDLQLDTSALADDYDLVILAYQVWFLAPSIPISSFLQTPTAASLLKGKPVVTVIACRNMWLQAQEKVKSHLTRCNASLVGNVVFVDGVSSAASFFSTPLWVLTGRKGPHWFGLVPAAGVKQSAIDGAARFGEKIGLTLHKQQAFDESLFRGMGAVRVNEKFIASEKIGARSFHVWGKLFLACGAPESLLRQFLALFYIVFLILMIVTVVPLTALIKTILKPFTKARVARQKSYYSWPSGE
ncbi:hypothetical protein [Gilvimarinus chinensis]|uniref:hypothetical protein n=1 Tax=Gilvimarinus chinensis TaxID=396005 RepID=UPI00037E0DFE|nr:hypothetical protein [Gilvimarinus chinensis]